MNLLSYLKTKSSLVIVAFVFVLLSSCSSSKTAQTTFHGLERYPVFPGCEEAVNQQDCFTKSLKKFVLDSYDKKVIRKEAYRGDKLEINAFFTITKEGDISNLDIKAPSTNLYIETARIFGTMPKMKPAILHGSISKMNINLPITLYTKKYR